MESSAASTIDHTRASSVAASLMPVMMPVLVVFIITGAALPALPLHIHTDLGFGTFVVGLVAGAQFVAALISRLWAGSYADRRGAKRAVIAGLVMAVLAGLLYLFSQGITAQPELSVIVLLAGRALLGGAESFIIIGAQSWGLALAGPGNSGKAIAWIGTAMFIALAVGAPIGSLLYGSFGFSSIGLATMGIPVLALLLVLPLKPVAPSPHAQTNFRKVARAVLLPGVGMAFASLGYGAMVAFGVLYFTEQGWQPAWLSFTLFAFALVLSRICFGGLPDRLGGARSAMVFVVVQTAGLVLIWLAPSALVGFAGAALTGFGYSFVYPGLGMEAVRRAPPESRGMAMGIYTAFLDVALGVLSPLLGLLAGIAGLSSVFGASALLALCTFPIAACLRSRQ
ncbi:MULTISPECIES: arabinose transporter [unclassified Mesorhizobium]|uniref:arabinose transporter n=1 Tax=unclassified Mesorhizobium TaxID=325217 RepID=UPI000FDA7AF0|nr:MULTISPECIES: arabinose transporter [unclassified Mesorhizobium]TGR23173.1 MFS transporter [Mesorhizobium sp. M8A.F.Ca.ET.197.01.1.1]TGR39257.1 MFS transporter [bacterium M00.F.Ca.ET.199.01.1.1]TGR46852.1 MFS transporter [Mesorhizobium sp. M8A.F.Ca.ET.198.01.1.1]TGV81910.1 MFS transporter [Mesorhizobium sp. M00.F.Ca.ET.149.01.1.1]